MSLTSRFRNGFFYRFALATLALGCAAQPEESDVPSTQLPDTRVAQGREPDAAAGNMTAQAQRDAGKAALTPGPTGSGGSPNLRLDTAADLGVGLPPFTVGADALPIPSGGDAGSVLVVNGGKAGPPFDLDRLHLVRVTSAFESDLRNSRKDVPCDIVFDGQSLPNSQCHRKGSYGSLSQNKPSLNVTFDAVTPQKLAGGISHIVLNNAQQDPSFLNEHLGYEIYRKAGQAAPLTSHALVYLNDKPLGFFVLKEQVGKDFLERSYGKAERDGNLYKAALRWDFAKDPGKMELKNEKEEMRSRTDINAAAAVVKNPPAGQFEQAADKIINLDQIISTMALDGILQHRDGPYGQSNNYYLFHRKADDRFVIIPHGMDWLCSTNYPLSDGFQAKLDPFAPLGNSGLVEPFMISGRIRAAPALNARFRARVGTLIRSAWIPSDMLARIDRVVAVLHQATDTSKGVTAELKKFDEFVPRWREMVMARKAFVESVAPAP